MRFIEGHVMFQIRGQNEPTHELQIATAKAHMWAHVCEEADGKYWQTGAVSPVRGGWGAW